MATGGEEVDSRVICSVCLEPYGRRQAKILPCFHTFCLPCLSGLVTREETSLTPDTPGLGAEEEGTKSASTVTCPSCRCIIPVPDGGASAFQTNFYLDSSNREGDAPPVPCYLCDGDQKAQFHCRQCQNNFCSQCRRSHDKLCKGGQVTALPDPSDSSSSTAQSPSHCQVRQQLQMVEDALKKLTEEEKKLNQERQAMDDSINVRYATLLGHAADARDTCCLSLREVYDGLTERLHSQVAEARQTRDTLQQQLSSSQPAPVSASQLRAALFLEGELPMILNRDLDSCSLLQHHREDNMSLMTNILQSFMGKVTETTQISSSPAQGKEPSGSTHFEEDSSAVSLLGSDPKNLNDLYEKFGDLAGRVTLLQSMNTQLTQLTQQVMQLGNANSKLSMEQSTLLREMTALKDRNVQLTTEQAGLKREVTAMRDKHAIVHQDLAVLTAEKDKMDSELGKIQKDVIFLQTDTLTQQTDILQLKAEHGDVVAKLGDVQTNITALQGEDAGLKKDVDQLKTDCSKLKSDMAKIQDELSDLKKGHGTLQADVTTSKSQVSSLQQKVQSAKKSEQDNRKALTTLESRLVRANTQAAFHAYLSKNTTITKMQTLICNQVISNVGGYYSNMTGVFTAPVAGTYCFLVTTGPCKADANVRARLDIVLEDELKGYVCSKGYNLSTGHTVVKMTTGQKVWLRTYDDEKYTFGGSWWTTFSGFLVQADV